MDKRLLTILQCPISHKGLAVANRGTLARVNKAIGEGQVSNRDGTVLSKPLTEALLTDDSKVLYPVTDGMPVMLEGESISMDQLD
jgi:uncharacterized protein YbaR (Trm112 family)